MAHTPTDGAYRIALIPGDGIGREIIPAIAAILRVLLPGARFVGEDDAAADLERAAEATLAAGVRTPDLGGAATTAEVCRAVSIAL